MLKSISTFLNAITGNLTFLGTGNRITGDFSNATIANRVMFQTSTVNGQTSVEFIPNGTSTASQLITGTSSSDSANASFAMLRAGLDVNEVRLASERRGTGTHLPMTFYTGSTERARIKTTGQVRFVPLASAPSGAEAGDVYYDSGTNKLRVYNGTSWVDLH